jgi:hypothetical protein
MLHIIKKNKQLLHEKDGYIKNQLYTQHHPISLQIKRYT